MVSAKRKALIVSETELALAMPAAEVNQQAFVQICRDYYPTVFAVAFRALGTREEAEDTVQETFLKLYQVWPHLRIRTSIRAWLARVAINDSYSRLRSRRRSQMLLGRLESGRLTVASAEEYAIAAHEARLVALALSRMGKRDRNCLILRYSGLSYQEVSDVTGVGVSSVGKVLQRAEEKLRQTYRGLEGMGYDEM